MKMLVLIAVAAVLLVTTAISLLGFSSGMTLVAEKLTKEPDEYIPLADPDPYVLQAISTPGEEVVVGAWENSEFDEMVETHGTNNVEIEGKYYRIDVYSKESFFWKSLFGLSLAGWSVLAITVVVSVRKLKITKPIQQAWSSPNSPLF